ncbi:conserved hypothetical protein, partial [Ixodes scapularis]
WRTRMPVQQIFLGAAAKITESTASQLSPTPVLRRTVRRQRQRTTFVCDIPPSREDIHLPPEYKVNLKQQAFLLHDSGDGDVNSIIFFATKRYLECLEGAGAWFCDGTSLFYQLYTPHALKNKIVVPMVYGLLPNKSEETYRSFFSVVIDNVGPCAVRVLYTDFEMAGINAARDVISDISIQGCFFHLNQVSVHRKLCALRFQTRYGNDEAFAG